MVYPPRIFTIVLNYRDTDDTLRCIRSLRESSYRWQFVVVVDNGSDDRSAAILREGLPATMLITSEENLGYAGGNNLGIRHALKRGADYVWILNPDTEVQPETLERMVRTMTRYPEIGIAGGRVLNGRNGGKTIWFNGGRIDWTTGARTSHIDSGRLDSAVPDDRIHDVDYVTGASMLVRRQVFDDVGLLPERYFLYFEETDFNVRAHRLGWRMVVDPRARLMHYQRSWGSVPGPQYIYYITRNQLLFASTFSSLPLEVTQEHFQKPLDAWRQKIARANASWVSAYDRLVTSALDDGRAGKDGFHPDLAGATWDSLSHG
jgi:GT2 family glycosyltransferase